MKVMIELNNGNVVLSSIDDETINIEIDTNPGSVNIEDLKLALRKMTAK